MEAKNQTESKSGLKSIIEGIVMLLIPIIIGYVIYLLTK